MRTLALALVLSLVPACAVHHPADGPRTAALGQAKIHYTFLNALGEADRRPALVFVHGWAGDMTVWDLQTSGWPRDRAILALDLPGFGASPDGGLPHSMGFYADAVRAVLDDAGVERAILIGHSMGTPVVRQFWRRYPERTAGLVLVDGSLRVFLTPEQAQELTAPLYTDSYSEWAGTMFDGISGAMRDPGQRARVREVMIATPQRSMQGGFEAMMDPKIWADDPITVPTLVLLAESPFWTDEYKAYVRSIAPSAEIVSFQNVSHFLMLDDPERFSGALLAWMVRNNL